MRKVIALSLLLVAALATPSEAVVPGPNLVVAEATLFVVDDVQVVSGAPVQFVNADVLRGPHDVASVERDGSGRRIFQSALIGPGVTEVDVSRAEVGTLYHFICSVHPTMVGTLTVHA